MSTQKIILVTGATGAQGGGVARHLLKQGRYTVRCLTRHPQSPQAFALQQAGAQVIGGDMDDEQSLKRAVEGCYGVYGVTNYWEHFENEYQQGKNLVDAVAASHVKHFVLSTLPHASLISNGTLPVPHFDAKARLEGYARSRVPDTTFLHAAFYFENFLTYFSPQAQPDGTLAFGFPQGDTPLAGIAAEDIGGVVTALFNNPSAFRGRTVGAVGEELPPATYAALMTQALGTQVSYQYIPRDVFAALGFPGAEDLANMFEFNRLYIPSRHADLGLSHLLYPAMQNFQTWLGQVKQRFPHLQKTNLAATVAR